MSDDTQTPADADVSTTTTTAPAGDHDEQLEHDPADDLEQLEDDQADEVTVPAGLGLTGKFDHAEAGQ